MGSRSDPGTGKLTVARELQKLTGFKLFHNHLTADLASSVFGYDNPDYFDYVRSLRLEAFERAANANISLIFTFWYSSISQPSVELYKHAIESRGGKVLFVRLHCRPEILEERVVCESRQNWKISSVTDLRLALENTGDVILGTHLEIENSDLSPEVVAALILEKLGLTNTLRLEAL